MHVSKLFSSFKKNIKQLPQQVFDPRSVAILLGTTGRSEEKCILFPTWNKAVQIKTFQQNVSHQLCSDGTNIERY